MIKKQTHDKSHLTIAEREIIQTGIENRSNKVDIARTIGKDPTTVAKEIKKHRILKPRNTFNYPVLCANKTTCRKGCTTKCDFFREPICKARDRSPGACNKCPKILSCRLDKYFYYADKANKEYKADLIEFREGINLTTKERDNIATILKPLIDQGQSIYQILSEHKDIKQCEKTIYNYIDQGVFQDFGIINISLKEKVTRKVFKDKYKKRKDPINYDGRKYYDYLKFIEENPYVPTTEMDTVMNDLSGPYIQTFIFQNSNFMIGFLHKEKNSESMGSTLDNLEKKLGNVLFSKLFSLILTDRGSEFEQYELFIANSKTGEIRLNIFYCDAMQSSQKPHVESNHNYIRDIIPNSLDITNITQKDLDLMFSHINSSPREILNGKTPYEMLKFFHLNDDDNEFEKIVNTFNITEIKRDEVILKPYLIKNIYKHK